MVDNDMSRKKFKKSGLGYFYFNGVKNFLLGNAGYARVQKIRQFALWSELILFQLIKITHSLVHSSNTLMQGILQEF